MRSFTTRQFRRLFAELPHSVQRQAKQAYRLFRQSSAHPGLHFKRVHDAPPIFSARVGIGYRALGAIDGDAVAWFWIGTHAEYDRLLDAL